MPTAVVQIRLADAWWQAHHQGAPNLLDDELDWAVATLRAHPWSGRAAPDADDPEVRRLLLRQVRHFVYYRVDVDRIEIVAFWHASRGTPPPL